MKKVFTLVVLMLAMLMTACGGKKKAAAPKEEVKKMNVGIVLSVGGLGDKSFNDAAYAGLEKAKEDLGIEFKYIEPATMAEDEQFLREFAENNYDLVIGVGFLMKDALEGVAKDFPNVKFALIDETVELDNVSCLLFKEDEGSFLVGALAAMMSETNTVGFVGGMEFPLIKKFENGYVEGAKFVNPDINTVSIYSGSFGDPVKGKENGLSLIGQGADVVYHAAGGTGTGVIDAAKAKGVYAIGVDADQDYIAEGTVLTSMVKKVDVAVYETVQSLVDGTFTAGVNQFGVAEGGVGTTEFMYTKEIIGKEKLEKLDDIRNRIISGDIVVGK